MFKIIIKLYRIIEKLDGEKSKKNKLISYKIGEKIKLLLLQLL